MEKDKKELLIKKIRLVVVIVIVALFAWFLIGYPFITLKSNEKLAEKAAKRYFEINSSELPTGTRLKTISLQTLYNKKILTDDLKGAYSKDVCSVTDSWVKVKRVDGDYKYFVYLDCGVLSSFVDHVGPKIILNGKNEITMNKGEEYKELGVKNVSDNTDGKLDVNNVKIDNSKVNTKKIGTYTVTYSMKDSFNNESVVERKVKVVSKLKNSVLQSTDNAGLYVGDNPKNYMTFSGMLFRIVGVSGDNVRIVADQDISYVNYSGIDKWLDYYYDNLTDTSKKFIVEDKYCNMNLDDNLVAVNTECSSYTDKKKAYILSSDDINKSLVNGSSFLQSDAISWTANKKESKEAYAVRKYFFGTDFTYMNFNTKFNFGVRPLLTIKGDSLLKGGDGTKDNPYTLGDLDSAKAEDKLNSRYTGEYVKYSGLLWRIINTENDGTTKVIADFSLVGKDNERILINYQNGNKAKVYNPKQNGNVGYIINNRTSQYVSDKYFVTKKISVPIYSGEIQYGKEKSTKQYSVKFSAPNIYEMFSGFDFDTDVYMKSYWLLNSSTKSGKKAIVADIGSTYDSDVYDDEMFGIRPVGYLDKNCEIVSGKGTKDNPYIISK